MNDIRRRTVFFVSDGTGITAETLGHSLLAQFPEAKFRQVRAPFVDDIDKAIECAAHIREAAIDDGVRPIVFSTLVNQATVDALHKADALFLDLFDRFIGPLEVELGQRSTHAVGRFHGIADSLNYKHRIEAINFAMAHDDGISSDGELAEADVILVGVSRSGKTPTSLYMALQFGIHVANYPLTEDDFDDLRLPASLREHKSKIYGLTIDPQRLSAIRNERRANSTYASLGQCQKEVRAVEAMFNREGVPFIQTTHLSIEEISTRILARTGLQRRLQ